MIPGNLFNKYQSRNPLLIFMMKIFKKDLDNFIKKVKPKNILDVGCGEGNLTNYIKNNNDVDIIAIDIGRKVIEIARKNNKEIIFEVGDIYKTRFKNNSFDCVIANEVLEHLEEPDSGIKELKRVSREFVLISVPNEPFFRMANISRLKYLEHWGNTPGHVQNWNRRDLKRLLGRHFNKVEIKNSTLWNFALCEK